MFLTWLIENVFFLEIRHQDNFERKGFYISKRISNFENYFHRKKSSQFFLFSRVEKFLLFTFQPNRKMKMRDFLTKRVFLGNFLEAKKKVFLLYYYSVFFWSPKIKICSQNKFLVIGSFHLRFPVSLISPEILIDVRKR